MRFKKFIKGFSVVSLILLILFTVTCGFVFLYYSANTTFDQSKLLSQNTSIEVYDSKGLPINYDGLFFSDYVTLDDIPRNVVNAFIVSEDKDFYKHKGVNYKRMAKAFLINIKNRKISQGASTISQQVVKNTHLGNERTLERKLKEIAITKKMEKRLSKNEILETYLNIIYFGNNCYGIENASRFYFSKPASKLTTAEGCVLAGLITAPNRYSPTHNLAKCKVKRDIVLTKLHQSKLIGDDEYYSFVDSPIKTELSSINSEKNNTYISCAIKEAELVLGIPAKTIALGGYKIYSHLDRTTQKSIETAVTSSKDVLNNLDYAVVNISPKNGAITGYKASSKYEMINVKRQPGSAIKPILVYAPALENCVISPASQVLDEPINLNGFSPKNFGKSYSGYVSARTALSKSLNVPAVKIMTYTGVEKSINFAKKAGLQFCQDDYNLASALGGLTSGTSLVDLTASYQPFVANGKYNKPTFISYITNSNGKIIYVHKTADKQIMRDDTAYLMNDMLKSTAKHGTARSMSALGIDVGAKTGTVGDSKGNSDAYNISETSENVLGVWVGDVSGGQLHDITGANEPTTIAKMFYKNEYASHKPKPVLMPSSCESVNIDLIDLKDNKVVKKANTFTPERYIVKDVFSKFNLPKEVSENYVNIESPEIENVSENEEKKIKFKAKDYVIYEVHQATETKDVIIKIVENYAGECEVDITSKSDDNCEIYVVAKVKNFANNAQVISKKSNIIKFNSSKKSAIKDNWFI